MKANELQAGWSVDWAVSLCMTNFTASNLATYTGTVKKRLSQPTFMPSVDETRSDIAVVWLLWKWMAINNNISPKVAFSPLYLQCKTNTTHLYQNSSQ